jgi:hypothetical protein
VANPHRNKKLFSAVFAYPIDTNPICPCLKALPRSSLFAILFGFVPSNPRLTSSGKGPGERWDQLVGMLTEIPSSSLLFDPGRARAPSQSEGTPHGTPTEEFPPIKLSDGTYKHTQKPVPGSPESRFPTHRDTHTNTHGGADRFNNPQRCRESVGRPVDVRRPLNSPPYELRLRRAFGLRSFSSERNLGPDARF